MKLYFNPTGCFLDRLPVVIRPPTLDEWQSQHAQTAEVVDPDPGGGWQGDCGGYAPNSLWTGQVTGHGGSLCGSSSCGCTGLLLSLLITLAKIKNLKNTLFAKDFCSDCHLVMGFWTDSELKLMQAKMHLQGMSFRSERSNLNFIKATFECYLKSAQTTKKSWIKP